MYVTFWWTLGACPQQFLCIDEWQQNYSPVKLYETVFFLKTRTFSVLLFPCFSFDVLRTDPTLNQYLMI